jgi:prepilin-type N-terminal cleavage/methylation domain-containing protein
MIFISLLKINKNNTGFTLVEVVIAVAIFSIISLAAFSLISNYNRTSDLIMVQLKLQSEGRSSLSQMVNDIRRTSGGSNGAFAIDSAGANSFVFYSNIDSDSYFEKIEYIIEGTELKKSVIKPSGNPLIYDPLNKTTTILSDKIANDTVPLFDYYDGSYAGTGGSLSLPVDITTIRFIKINLILDDNPSAPTSPQAMEAKVTLRNLKDN